MNMMEQKNMLSELLENAQAEWDAYLVDCRAEEIEPEITYCDFLAVHLFADGVIVLPCKIGDTVYYIHEELTMAGVKTVISTRKITGYGGNGFNPVWMVSAVPYELRFHPSEFGRTVFLSREEAENAVLKKRGGETP